MHKDADAAGLSTITRPASYRWMQLLMGIVCMAMIANLQYGWTLFVNPIADKYGWTKAAIQVAFTIFVLTETWLVPIEGYLVDRFGPRPVVMIGGLFCGVGWVLNSFADSLVTLYIAAAISGIGAGAVYGTCVGNALKWFSDRRGLAAGAPAAGFGAGSALTILPITAIIKSSGYESAFLYFGIGQGLIVVLMSLFLTDPRHVKSAALRQKAAQGSTHVQQTRRDYRPMEVLRRPVFWVMYVMFVLVAAGGLMATAQLAPIAKDFMIMDVPVSLIGIPLPALTFALSIDRILNGITRPFFGWVSDNIGRENTMGIAFILEGIAIYLMLQYRTDPFLLVVLSGLVFFAWGEIFSLFPSTLTDTFGTEFATTNYGFLYMAQGIGSILCAPGAAMIYEGTGSWKPG